MVMEPRKRISERALKVWRIYGIILFRSLFILAGGVIAFTIAFNWPVWISIVSVLLFAIIPIFFCRVFSDDALETLEV